MEFETEVYTDEYVSTNGAAITTAGASISTASPLRVSTAEEISTTETLVYIRKSAAKYKGKAKMDESEPEKTKTKLQQKQERVGYEAAVRLQERLDVEERKRIARVIQEEEREKYSKAKKARLLAELINQRKRCFAQQRAEERRNKPLTQAQQRTYMSNYINHMGSHTLQQLKKLSFDELKNLFKATMRRVGTFVPMETEIKREAPELVVGCSKRDAEEELNQWSFKRQNTGENSKPAEESKEKVDGELSQDKLQQLMIIVLEEGFNSADPTEDKEIELWVELKRLFKPDVDYELWKSQKHVHDITWRLYDTCGVHHVSTKDGIDIYMLVEKEYPLSRGVLTQMLAAKLLVEQNNKMSRELLRNIFMMAERPRR
ncbi:hypothetical protein Tco_0938088 [Tanacetum coccineum]|uniref:Uncharacterized protein n=1 Tax=Tanacetum coccineum TaxID=301880 RepID=A0ABQ5DI34_9ASTR